MKKFLLQFFTWWNGETLGTRLHTWRFGKSVGEDSSAISTMRAAPIRKAARAAG